MEEIIMLAAPTHTTSSISEPLTAESMSAAERTIIKPNRPQSLGLGPSKVKRFPSQGKMWETGCGELKITDSRLKIERSQAANGVPEACTLHL